MTNCDSEIRAYHRQRVALTSRQRQDLKYHRDSNRSRLRSGLRKNDDPQPTRSVSQGSYAMRTVIQEPNNAYDIDDGVVFTEQSLKGPKGGEMSPLDARKMVCAAVHSDSFATSPEVHTNCVRVHYHDGSHVDIPVYRELEDWSGSTSYELASAEWKKSDPDGVKDWFKRWLEHKRNNGQKHSRELIRLMKSICKNRPSYSLPSGFEITVLIEECYSLGHDRLDEDLRSIIRAVYSRLCSNLRAQHPVVHGEWLIDCDSEHKTRNLRDLLGRAVPALDGLEVPNCTRSKALKVWKKVLCPGSDCPGSNFFDDRIAEAGSQDKARSESLVAGLSSAPKPYGYSGGANSA